MNTAAADPLSLPAARDLLDRMAEADALIERLYETIGVPRPRAPERVAIAPIENAPSPGPSFRAASLYAAEAVAGQVSIAVAAFAATTLVVLTLTLLTH